MIKTRLVGLLSHAKKYIVYTILWQWAALLSQVLAVFSIADLLEKVVYQNVTTAVVERTVIALILVVIIRFFCERMGARSSYLACVDVKRILREKIYEKMLKLGASYNEQVSSSEVVQVSTEGVEQLETYFGKYLPQLFYSLIAPVTLFVILSRVSLKASIILLICVPLIPVSIVAVQKIAKKLLDKYWSIYTGLGDSFLENLQGLTTLKIYQADERYAEKMDEEAEKFRKVTMRVLIMQLNSISVMDIVAYGGAAVGMILSILELRSGAITLAQCFFIIMVSAEFFLPLRMLGSFFHIAMNGNEAANKIFALLDSKEPDKGSRTSCDGDEICFSHVTFGYEESKQVLKDVSFTIPEKSFTAIVGVSGCGKSTTASLLMGDLSENSGEITIGGVKVKEMKESFLNKKVTRVRHDSYLFQGTLRDNLAMAMETPDDAKMYEALKQVELYETVMEKGGLSMEIMEKAANLSGGQKQRVALARAILHDSDIYIFDEAASNVDVESENKIMEVIMEIAKEKTVILISHRLANVINADQVLVMREGVIEECGTHVSLMEKQGYYRELFCAQKELEEYAKEICR